MKLLNTLWVVSLSVLGVSYSALAYDANDATLSSNSDAPAATDVDGFGGGGGFHGGGGGGGFHPAPGGGGFHPAPGGGGFHPAPGGGGGFHPAPGGGGGFHPAPGGGGGFHPGPGGIPGGGYPGRSGWRPGPGVWHPGPGLGGCHFDPVYFRGGGYPWYVWDHPYFVRPIFYWNWDAVQSVTCVSQDSVGDDFPVTEAGYIGIGYQDRIVDVEDASLNRCFEESNGDPSCHLVGCTPTY